MMRGLVLAVACGSVRGGSLKAIVAVKGSEASAVSAFGGRQTGGYGDFLDGEYRSRQWLVSGPGDASYVDARGPSGYAVATLYEANGTVASLTPTVEYTSSASMPGCNAAASSSAYWQTSPVLTTMAAANGSKFHNCAGCAGGAGSKGHCCSDPTDPSMTPTCFKDKCSKIPAGAVGEIRSLGLDVNSGAIILNKTFSPPAVSPPFAAWDAALEVAWAVVPYSYTALGLFKIDYAKGTQTKVKDFAKSQTDGVGVCEGRVFADSSDGHKLLAYQFGGVSDELRVVDLDDSANFTVKYTLPGFYAGLVVDPLFPHRLLAVKNNHHDKGVAILSIDPAEPNGTKTLFNLPSTPAGRMLRAQDQADFALRPDGLRAWFVASYNVADGKLVRGLFTLDLDPARDNATLVSTVEAFSDDDSKPWFGTLDYFP